MAGKKYSRFGTRAALMLAAITLVASILAGCGGADVGAADTDLGNTENATQNTATEQNVMPNATTEQVPIYSTNMWDELKQLAQRIGVERIITYKAWITEKMSSSYTDHDANVAAFTLCDIDKDGKDEYVVQNYIDGEEWVRAYRQGTLEELELKADCTYEDIKNYIGYIEGYTKSDTPANIKYYRVIDRYGNTVCEEAFLADAVELCLDEFYIYDNKGLKLHFYPYDGVMYMTASIYVHTRNPQTGGAGWDMTVGDVQVTMEYDGERGVFVPADTYWFKNRVYNLKEPFSDYDLDLSECDMEFDGSNFTVTEDYVVQTMESKGQGWNVFEIEMDNVPRTAAYKDGILLIYYERISGTYLVLNADNFGEDKGSIIWRNCTMLELCGHMGLPMSGYYVADVDNDGAGELIVTYVDGGTGEVDYQADVVNLSGHKKIPFVYDTKTLCRYVDESGLFAGEDWYTGAKYNGGIQYNSTDGRFNLYYTVRSRDRKEAYGDNKFLGNIKAYLYYNEETGAFELSGEYEIEVYE